MTGGCTGTTVVGAAVVPAVALGTLATAPPADTDTAGCGAAWELVDAGTLEPPTLDVSAARPPAPAALEPSTEALAPAAAPGIGAVSNAQLGPRPAANASMNNHGRAQFIQPYSAPKLRIRLIPSTYIP